MPAGLARQIRDGGGSTDLEVVSLDRGSEIRSVRAAVGLGVDYLLGGTHAEDVLPLLAGTSIRYYPFPGRITGHRSLLEGSQAEIVQSAVALASHPGVAGLDLLAYRSVGNVPWLMEAVCRAVAKPVIVAGSVDRPDQIEIIRRSGAAGFTVGTSALDGRFPAESTALEFPFRTARHLSLPHRADRKRGSCGAILMDGKPGPQLNRPSAIQRTREQVTPPCAELELGRA